MEPIHSLLLPPGYEIEEMRTEGPAIGIRAATQHRAGICPGCGRESTQIHGYYRREVDDLPISGFTVRIRLKVRRFRCNNEQCERQTFSSTSSDLVAPHQRKSGRLISTLYHIGQALGGRAGARLTKLLCMGTSRDTLLRIVRAVFQPEPCAPHAVGVDDWAMCRGHSYGTIVVDLEKHQVIDLLPSRSADTLSQWLAHHPQISLVSRDRSPEYRSAVTDMLPEAVQVVDRWHLVKNLREALERSLEDLYPKSEMRDDTILSRGSEPALRTRFPRSGADEQLRSGRRQQRIQRYQIVQELKSHGMSIRRISRLLGLPRGTVRSFYFADTYPETQRRKTRPSMLDPYLPYLERRVQDGCTNAKQLWREIVARGYPGAPGQVSKWMTWRRRQNIDGVSPGMSNSSGTGADLMLPSRRTLSRILFTDPSQLDAHETMLLKLVKQNRMIAVVHELVRTFRGMIATKQTAEFDGWLAACHRSNVPAMNRFANSIQQDRTAVLAAISTHWSNGQTEGHVNRLKMLKRQMYGRANLDLLRARVLYCVDTT